MSIYASLPAPADLEHTSECAIWIKRGSFWEMRDLGTCDCGQPDTPIVYQGSHVMPEATDRRGGGVDIALIPAHVRYWREHPDAPIETEPVDGHEPFLRFGVYDDDDGHATVILDVRGVRQIYETLGDWLEATE